MSTTRRSDVQPDQFGDGFRALGPRPRWTSVYRWADVAGPVTDGVPPLPTYTCRRVASPISIDGRVDKEPWASATWTDAFRRIDTGADTGHGVRMALLWDDDHLYAAYDVTDPDIRALTTEHHAQLYMTDDDVELFIDCGSRYLEIGLNAINTEYGLRWTWVEPLVEARDHAAIEELFKTPDFIYAVARPGERSGRLGDMGWEVPGVRHAVHIEGTVNHPGDVDRGWTVEMALPWAGLRELGGSVALPPRPGDTLRIQGFRAQHDRSDPVRDAELDARWPGATAADWYSWSVMGNTNVHNPERWVPVRFTDKSIG